MTPSLLCETIAGDTMAELMAARERAAAADLLELRLDGVRDLDVAQALHGRHAPVIATCRPAWEGGRFDGSEEERCAVLSRALALGADYVDLEWRALGPFESLRVAPSTVEGQHAQGSVGFLDLIRANGPRVIVSSHDFAGVPDDLGARVRAMRSTGAAVIKVAVSPTRLSDTLALHDIAKAGDAVVVGMGDAGVPTRLLASRFGSRWTYGGNGIAPGQMPAARMLQQFRFRTVNASTAVYGAVGRNVVPSVSPVMHNAAFAAAGLDAVCVPLCAADYADFLTFADAMGIVGAGVTVPFTLDALQASRQSDDLARRVGAADTIRRVHGGWEATNTAAGALDPIEATSGSVDSVARLVAQVERQFEWWTGRRPAPGVMRAAALAETSHRATETQRGI